MILAWLASFDHPDKCKPKQRKEEMSGNAGNRIYAGARIHILLSIDTRILCRHRPMS
jgi:hypothetical protein